MKRIYLLLLALVLFSGCAIFPPDYVWERVYPASARYEWHVKSRAEVEGMCPRLKGSRSPGIGCASQIMESSTCYVFSNVSEDVADRWTSGDGLSLREHELKHCDGWRHQ